MAPPVRIVDEGRAEGASPETPGLGEYAYPECAVGESP